MRPVENSIACRRASGAGAEVGTAGRRRLFALAAMLLGLLPFVAAEATLRLLDLGRPSHYRDPFVGFSRIWPLFELDRQAGQYRTAQSRLYFFAPQQFAAQKPAGGFRIFWLGGSTVLGHPYQPDTAMTKWAELELAAADPSRHCESVNCGGMSYASYRLVPILEEVLGYDPDLIVVASGHNEFLEDRTYQSIKHRHPLRAMIEDRLYSLRLVTAARAIGQRLRGPAGDGRTVLKDEVDARLDHESGYASYHRAPQWRRAVVAHYEHNLRAMVRLCRAAGVPVILVNLGCNLRDCPPFKAEHRGGLTADQLARWHRAVDRGREAEATAPARALNYYRHAEAIDDQHALLVYRIAKCLDRLGRFDAARRAYLRAKELDVCPLRMLEPMHQALFRVAEEMGVPVVDARHLLEARSQHGIPGHDWFLDQVHPTIRGHQLIAQAVVETMRRMGLAPATGALSRGRRRRLYARHLANLGQLYLAQGRTRVQWLENWARRDRLRPDDYPLDVGGWLQRGHVHLAFGELPEALAAYSVALAADRSAAASPLFHHALKLFRQGRTEAAARVVKLLRDRRRSPPALGDRLALAALVLALEQHDTAAAKRAYVAVKDKLDQLASPDNPWVQQMPDLADRLRRAGLTDDH